jgi:hypothetical protein
LTSPRPTWSGEISPQIDFEGRQQSEGSSTKSLTLGMGIR